MGLAPYVKLYRDAGKPPFSGGVFSGNLQYGVEAHKLIRDLLSTPKGSVFDELIIDNVDIDTPDDLPETWQSAEYSVRIPTNAGNRFHNTISSFISDTPLLALGKMPDDFYIVSDDSYSKDDKQHEKIGRLGKICLLIQKLSILAHYHDTKAAATDHKLVFIRPNDAETSKPVELVTKIDEKMLEYEPPDICLLDELCDGSIKTDLHFNARKGVFGVTLTDFLKAPHPDQSAFAFLLRNWSEFIGQYLNNLNTYISGFAFHKAKKEVAEAELQVAENFSNVISGITGKVLSVPISLVAVIAVLKADSFLEDLLLVIGLTVASLIISSAVRNQQLQLDRVIDGKKLMFDSFEGRAESYPKELKTALNNMITSLNTNEGTLRHLLWFFRLLSWAPAFSGAALFLHKHSDLLSWWGGK